MIEQLPFLIFNDSFIFTNLTEDEISHHPYSPEINIIIAIIGTFTSLLTISGNVLVLVSFFVDRQIR